jgi:hypothetical protein
VIEKKRDVTFNLQDHLLGGVSAQRQELRKVYQLTKT